MLCDTSGKVTAEGSLLDLLLSDLLGSEMILHVLLCPSVLPASSDPLSRQRSTTQKISVLSALQREEIVSTAIYCLDAKNPELAGKKPQIVSLMCVRRVAQRIPVPLVLAVVTELQT